MSANINTEQANRLWSEFAGQCLGGAIDHWAGEVGRNEDGSLRLHSSLELPKTVITSDSFFRAMSKWCFDRRPSMAKERDELWRSLESGKLSTEMTDYLAQVAIIGGVAFE